MYEACPNVCKTYHVDIILLPGYLFRTTIVCLTAFSIIYYILVEESKIYSIF